MKMSLGDVSTHALVGELVRRVGVEETCRLLTDSAGGYLGVETSSVTPAPAATTADQFLADLIRWARRAEGESQRSKGVHRRGHPPGDVTHGSLH